MRRVCLGVSAISTFLFASWPENPANAMTLGAPAAMRTAIVDIAVTYRAHCRPGRVHHRYWPYDGCAQGYVSPSYHYRPRPAIRLVTQQHISHQVGLNGRPQWRAQIGWPLFEV